MYIYYNSKRTEGTKRDDSEWMQITSDSKNLKNKYLSEKVLSPRNEEGNWKVTTQ